MHPSPLVPAGGAAAWLLRAWDELLTPDARVKVIPRCPYLGLSIAAAAPDLRLDCVAADNSPQGAQESLSAGSRVSLAAWHGEWARGMPGSGSPGGRVTPNRWCKGLKAGNLPRATPSLNLFNALNGRTAVPTSQAGLGLQGAYIIVATASVATTRVLQKESQSPSCLYSLPATSAFLGSEAIGFHS